MFKTRGSFDETTPGANAFAAAAASFKHKHRPRIALLSNPRSTGNLAQLPRIREFCADHPDVFHYEVEHADQIGHAMEVIARVRPKVFAINGGDGTVQAALTELHNGGHFGDNPPPVAVLPSGKTNLIAIDLGARGDPIEALKKLIDVAQGDLEPYVVARELIALRHGEEEATPVIGMFLGGAGLAETMIYCRDKIYPLGLPNSIAHVLTAAAAFAKVLLRAKASFLPPDPQPVHISLRQEDSNISGRFSLLAVTTLERLLLSFDMAQKGGGPLKLLAIEEHPTSLLRALGASIFGKLGHATVPGVHFQEAHAITIEGESSDVILDGETFRAESGRPIHLRPAQPLSFVKLAA